MKLKLQLLFFAMMTVCCSFAQTAMEHPAKEDVLNIIKSVNGYWQKANPRHGNYFWNRAVYHVGNMEAYRTTGEEAYLNFSRAWAEQNNYSGPADRGYWDPVAGEFVKNNWVYGYGENNVLFGDCQICFQVYSELVDSKADEGNEEMMLARANEVMGYEINTPETDYLWWADGLFMVMPVMTHMYHQTHDVLYLDRMYDYWRYAVDLMWDTEEHLFYRDAKYVYPKHTTQAGGKDFWARGDGWVVAALARVMNDMNKDVIDNTDIDAETAARLKMQYDEYKTYFLDMLASLKKAQQPEGHWTRSILDPNQAPGYETSGTALMLYGYLWAMNNGVVTEAVYGETAEKAWRYLTEVALAQNGMIGYVQPIGENASPGTTVGASSTADFGVGAMLLAASEMYRYATEDGYWHKTNEANKIDDKLTYNIQQKVSGLYLNLEPERVVLGEEPQELSFVPVGDGTYYVTNGTEYMGLRGTDNWNMTGNPDRKTWWMVTRLEDGVYSLTCPNGSLGTDGTTAGSPCYADKSSTSSRSAWNFIVVGGKEEPDAVSAVEADRNNSKDNRMYDLVGRPVTTPAKGIYIMNGKKRVIF